MRRRIYPIGSNHYPSGGGERPGEMTVSSRWKNFGANCYAVNMAMKGERVSVELAARGRSCHDCSRPAEFKVKENTPSYASPREIAVCADCLRTRMEKGEAGAKLMAAVLLHLLRRDLSKEE